MSERLLLTIFSIAVLSATASAQSNGATAPKDPDPNVFLDNHRPMIEKKQKAPTSRTVTGKVVDDTGQPLEGALVTLTDGKTHAKTTAITKKDGRYNFEDLSFTIDYEVQARYKDSLSPVRKLSQYDHTANVVRILEIASDTPPAAEAKK
ncbi:MAG TPA: carboxypeptidase-like regulatory domain-containing protein [Bryobacteraceae bacterium]|jgi:phosphate-selective porin|nr:carboxypeptidase-like regulatory domain-containing protein [Bryobacteraceae bacterium]